MKHHEVTMKTYTVTLVLEVEAENEEAARNVGDFYADQLVDSTTEIENIHVRVEETV